MRNRLIGACLMAALAIAFGNSLANKVSQGELHQMVAESPLGNLIMAKASPVSTSRGNSAKSPAMGVDETPVGSISSRRANNPPPEEEDDEKP